MQTDTGIGGPNSRFPETRRTVILDLRHPDSAIRHRAIEAVLEMYWKPVYKYIRARWNRSNESAKDLAQSFFTRALEKEFLGAYEPEKARFRTYLRVCLDAFLSNENKSTGRLKRGGDRTAISLDSSHCDGERRHIEIASSQPSPEEYFRREWVRNLFSLAAEDLRQECVQQGKETWFEIFRRYDLADGGECPTYDDLAVELGLANTTVTNHLAAMRRRFRQLLIARVEETTLTEQEFREEIRDLLGIEG